MSQKRLSFGGLLVALGLLAGCAKSVESQPVASDAAHDGHEHHGWWCVEHGVPEEVCALCNSKVAADYQAKGDWCTKHDRPESQCFVCQPGQQAKFAAQYEAKFGEQPPKPTL